MVKKNASLAGRQKIAMAKIMKKSHLQVTFSKRRAGLFNKASELCTLCGVDVAIIVFSPAGRVYSFGHPQPDSIIDRFLGQNPPPPANNLYINTLQLLDVEAHRDANIRELNVKLTHLHAQLEAERKRGEALDELRKANRRQCWWQAPIDELGLNELETLRDALTELKKDVAKQANKVLVEPSNLWPLRDVNAIGMGYVGGLENRACKIDAAASEFSLFDSVYNFGQELF